MSMKSDKAKQKNRKRQHFKCDKKSDQPVPWKRDSFLEKMIRKETKQ